MVQGPSGVGKTTLVRRTLREIEAPEQEWLAAQNPEDLRKLNARLAAGFRGHLVVDDFHRLDTERRSGWPTS